MRLDDMSGSFDAAVTRQLHELRHRPFDDLERAAVARRTEWVRNRNPSWGDRRPTPRDVYELFFEEYLGLDLDEVPVVEETDSKIVWRSFNRCPTLEACTRLGLDTREVCRRVYEKSTQAFVAAIDPGLRFGRSYERIRPHAEFCEEWIERGGREES